VALLRPLRPARESVVGREPRGALTSTFLLGPGDTAYRPVVEKSPPSIRRGALSRTITHPQGSVVLDPYSSAEVSEHTSERVRSQSKPRVHLSAKLPD
jgi:hypothetical protein